MKTVKELMEEREKNVRTLNATFDDKTGMSVSVKGCSGADLLNMMEHLVTMMAQNSNSSSGKIIADLIMLVGMEEVSRKKGKENE